ncbi:Heat shock protein DnaJ with tetratricopeptide repeat putative isoform 3 [Tripterygium wilfordii]|uniref:Heat shock protein DnaJ with tetratricopeptide repeat putative isoform 3 n=1 Tax=Tripterygium wilfordii TaxID=458696 RepID=A0A7J7CAT1_TRIWF|nr:Heat shock protein DnaJ with tetratricopeptide repeat putative isoform 3 [Tripterygium wilfordii]
MRTVVAVFVVGMRISKKPVNRFIGIVVQIENSRHSRYNEQDKKVFESFQLSADLLLRRATKDTETALEVIADALSISSYSEKLLEMRAGRSSFPDGDSLLGNPDGSEVSKSPSFRLWRCLLIFRSLFHLGKLEEEIASLEKHEVEGFTTRGNGSKALESSIPLVATVHELLRHRAAGNEAFQAGRHSEAIEHYTSALSCNGESRPFAAICFCNRAAAYKALGQIIDAIADCSLAIALDGNYLKVFL